MVRAQAVPARIAGTAGRWVRPVHLFEYKE
jgi:hypothetical protein